MRGAHMKHMSLRSWLRMGETDALTSRPAMEDTCREAQGGRRELIAVEAKCVLARLEQPTACSSLLKRTAFLSLREQRTACGLTLLYQQPHAPIAFPVHLRPALLHQQQLLLLAPPLIVFTALW